MPVIISFRDAEVVTSKIITRLESLERKSATAASSIDTSKFLTKDSIQGILNNLLQGFVHTLEIALDSIREGAGISHYKKHTFKNETIFKDVINIGANVVLLSDNTLELGSDTFRWLKGYFYSLELNGSIIQANDGAGDLGDATNSFGTVYTGGLFLKSSSGVDKPARIDAGKNLIQGAIDLSLTSDVTGILALSNGGTGGSDDVSARASLSVYSIAEIDALLAGKATAGIETGPFDDGDGAHTHTQLA